MIKINPLFILLYSLVGNANTYDLGKKYFTHYYGHYDPQFSVNRFNRELIFKDIKQEQLYFTTKINDEIFDLKNYFDTEFEVGRFCPESELKEVEKYYTYLSRLLTVSYMFEAFREYEFSTKLLGGKNSCLVNWNKLFSKCHPKETEMKLFLKNLKHTIPGIKDIVVPFELSKKSGLQKWLRAINSKKLISLGQYRLVDYCKENNCKNSSREQAVANLDKICQEDQSFLLRVCSEQDHTFGLSYAPELYPLLLRSNAIRSTGIEEFQAGCLRRFIHVYQTKEEKYVPLKRIFSYLYSYYQDSKIPQERGRLFAIGALKEFREKGLANIFDEKKKKSVQKTVVIKKVLTAPKFEEIILPKFTSPRKKKKNKKRMTVVVQAPRFKKSAFFIASDFQQKFGLNKVAVDMVKFKYDYTFTLSQEQDFNVIVTRFSSQKSLKDMYKYDKIGSAVAPIPLRFIKYLIDKDMHQGLYNIIYILGDRFYIRNDIDRDVRGINFISLKNDRSTQYKWKLEILKEKVTGNTKPPGKRKL